ncbi:hypothetical protein ACFQFS_07945 [Novosphingobium lubricantis]
METRRTNSASSTTLKAGWHARMSSPRGYAHAIAQGDRFYSYGDSSLLLS